LKAQQTYTHGVTVVSAVKKIKTNFC